jgi:hypothetical protein
MRRVAFPSRETSSILCVGPCINPPCIIDYLPLVHFFAFRGGKIRSSCLLLNRPVPSLGQDDLHSEHVSLIYLASEFCELSRSLRTR